MSCDISADTPTIEFDSNDIGTIVGTGHRECTTSTPATITVRLRKDIRWWPDKTLASITVTGSTIHQSVAYRCTGRGSQTVFTEIIVKTGSGTQKAQSARRSFSLCS